MRKTSNRSKMKKNRVAAIVLGFALAVALNGQAAERELDSRSPRFSDTLLARGEPALYQGDRLEAISLPVGGIGAGCIQFNGKAERHIWQIFNNFYPVSFTHSFFAVRVKVGQQPSVVRALQTSAVGPFTAMKSLTFRGEYPFGWFDFEDPNLPVHISMEVFSPFIPLDAKNSSLPCVIHNLTALNTCDKPVEVTFLASQQNAVGYQPSPEQQRGPRLAVFDPRSIPKVDGQQYETYGSNRNEILRNKGAVLLHMSALSTAETPGSGDMTLLGRGGRISATASWQSREQLAVDLSNNGVLDGPENAGPTPSGSTVDGALASSIRLMPGEKKTVHFILTWYFPHGRSGNLLEPLWPKGWSFNGRMYANWWPSSLDAAEYLSQNLEELAAATRMYHDALYETNLPYYVLDRISSQLSCLRTTTCFWADNGYFGGWEGSGIALGSCKGNCTHVWQYAQAYARLFPEIARRMREQALSCQNASGGIPHRQPSSFVAFDGQCGEILAAYREHCCSPDKEWLDKQWTRIRLAMDFVIRSWDQDEDGVLKGLQPDTLDASLSGSTSWHGTLYIAALAAAEKMALLENEPQAAQRYVRIRRSGQSKQDETLFDSDYYVQIPDRAPGGAPGKNYLNGCHIDQLLGQWWMHQLDLGWAYPPPHVRTALESLFRNNFRTHWDEIQLSITGGPRKFVLDDDYGLKMTTWPKGGRPEGKKVWGYADEVMSGFEYSAAATMLYSSLINEALSVVRAASDRYNGRLRTGLSIRAFGYSGNPFGDDEAGKSYSRAMSSWSLLLASQGFIYDGPAGHIGFKPVWKPEEHVSFFTAAEGWGVFRQQRGKRAGMIQSERIEIRYGRLRVNSLVFAYAKGARPTKVSVRLDKQLVPSAAAISSNEVLITLKRPLTISAGSALDVSMN